MARTLSTEKCIRQSEKRRQRNKIVKSTVKTAVRKFLNTISAKDLTVAKNELINVCGLLDKAVSKGVVHKNSAARRKSRLAHKLNALTVT